MSCSSFSEKSASLEAGISSEKFWRLTIFSFGTSVRSGCDAGRGLDCDKVYEKSSEGVQFRARQSFSMFGTGDTFYFIFIYF